MGMVFKNIFEMRKRIEMMKKTSYMIPAKADLAIGTKIIEWKHHNGCDAAITGIIEIEENFASQFEKYLIAHFSIQITHLADGMYTFHNVPISAISMILDAHLAYLKYIELAKEGQWHQEN